MRRTTIEGKEMKSAFKKLTSIAVAVLMAALLVPAAAFAEGEGRITIDNPETNREYTAYKIFDVVYNGDKDAYSYTINKTAPNSWFNDVIGYMGNNGSAATANAKGAFTGKGITLTPSANNSDIYVVTLSEEFSAPSFAMAMKEKVTANKQGASLTSAAGYEGVTVGDLDLGYYLVTTDSGALCNLTTTNPTANIHDKNDVPFNKVADKKNVEIGETVKFTITGAVPDTTGAENITEYTYKISDKMTRGLTFKNDIKIMVGDEDITSKTDKCTIMTGNDAGEKDFVISIDVTKFSFDTPIVVTYSATVNENAAGGISNNNATLEYSNNPDVSSDTQTKTDNEQVYSAKINIVKYAKKAGEAADAVNPDMNTKLEHAKFVLKNEAGKYYKYTAAEGTNPAKVEWVDGNGTTVETDANGAASFLGLKDGKYYLVETEAPAGYNLLTEPVEVNIKGTDTDNTTPVEANLTKSQPVANNTGSILPSTGGIGTTIFYVGGGLLIVGALAALIIKRRSAKHSA
ncbi:SpaH/EbpB family LPXTG-anchored major pilin [Adlercreutzia sp. ZJ138]|uniref:SpaH/EbpB family LPXTG-anchored major pilin n=1 Tax=Adlercreutzia sp. ZJ138 TaxID=2709405 RepID=UPI0013ED777E|nr:SpaH/EbpB family LPXTG-anchored major pilin [Adlercreutzia sp. ZJ138]